ncbi:nucleotidyltransferase family protein [Pseudorhodobacter sp. E13]|uniref:nucleotidyltransferase family protein n=1 Tax=Pseudorhodobacter sp. E13 TaxID=2487931 RepID=UPI000F8D65C8|nr:nucleotidyltransferase family protein [Pseudorhodobacter sp. E13]RUS59288.1 nucleotidyltransferase family protein [Pseudorhodobacter sp. E13]
MNALPPPLCVLVLAAGAARRMRGADKLLEPVGGLPLLRRVAEMALGTGLPVWVALPPDRPARAMALKGLPLGLVTVPDAAEGMAASLRAGLADCPEGAAVLLLLADMPEIDAADLTRMIAAHQAQPQHILRGACADGRPGHPVLFPAWARAELAGLHGDSGAKPLLQAHAGRVSHVPLPDTHALTDLDTPEDWAAWRAARG